MFLNEQSEILEITAMGESKDLKRPKRLQSSQLEPYGRGDTIILGFICKTRIPTPFIIYWRKESTTLRFSSIFHYSSQIETTYCFNTLTCSFLNIINCLDQGNVINIHWNSMKVSFQDRCFKYLSELPHTSLIK